MCRKGGETMLIKNNTHDIYILKYNSRKIQLNPWQTRDVDPVFFDDPTFRQGIATGCLVRVDEEAPSDDGISDIESTEPSQEAQEAVSEPFGAENEETAVENVEAPVEAAEAETEVKTTKSTRKK